MSKRVGLQWKVLENTPNSHHTTDIYSRWVLENIHASTGQPIAFFQRHRWAKLRCKSSVSLGKTSTKSSTKSSHRYIIQLSHHNFLSSFSVAAIRRLLWCHLGLWGRSSTSTQAGSLCCERSFQANPEKEQPRAPVDLFVRNSDCRCSLHPWVHLQWRNRGPFHKLALT